MAKRKPRDVPPADPSKLVRETPGRYRTGDGRFTVEQESAGVWYVADAEQTNEFGLPLLRGPFGTLADARAALGEARDAPAPAAPEPKRKTQARPKPGPKAKADATSARTEPNARGAEARPATRASERAKPEAAPAEPAWLAKLSPARRREAESLIEALAALDVDDPPATVRREVERDEAAVARALLGQQVEASAVEPWRTGSAWLRAVRAGRGPLGPLRPIVERLASAGVTDEDLAELASAIADRSAGLTLEVVESEGFRSSTGKPPRGWRLVELGRDGKPTGRTVARRADGRR
ncbi:MAG: hypothetical protein ACJ761_06425 [Chloroflexota bacterium]